MNIHLSEKEFLKFEIKRLQEANQAMLEALKLAQHTLFGANMNMNVVHKEVKEAIAKGEQQ